MKNGKTKGFTLIEVILSIAIFAIISVGFLGMFSTVFISTFRSTSITEDIFLEQQGIEEKIALAKSALEEGNTPTGLTSSTFEMFSGANLRNVVVYQIEQGDASKQGLETYVAQTRAPLLQTPNIDSGVKIAVFDNTSGVPVKENFPNIGMITNHSLDLDVTLSVDNPGLLIRYLYYWYISNPGYYIPSNPPIFPDNYEIIPDFTSSSISTIPASYAGRFIKLVVTPVGEKGQMGTSVESNAVYISTMPINTNVIFHIDSNYINKDDATQVQNTTVSGKVYSFINKCIDISSSKLDMAQSSTSLRPILYQYTLGLNSTARIIQGSLGNPGGSNNSLKSTTSTSLGSFSDLTVYFVAKFDSALPNGTIIFQTLSAAATNSYSGRWALSTGSTGKLVLDRYITNTTKKTVETLDSSYKDSTWKIFKLDIWKNKLSIKIDNGDETVFSNFTNPPTMKFMDLRINFDSNLSIGEVIIFKEIQEVGSDNSIAIYKYLNDKYKP